MAGRGSGNNGQFGVVGDKKKVIEDLNEQIAQLSQTIASLQGQFEVSRFQNAALKIEIANLKTIIELRQIEARDAMQIQRQEAQKAMEDQRQQMQAQIDLLTNRLGQFLSKRRDEISETSQHFQALQAENGRLKVIAETRQSQLDQVNALVARLGAELIQRNALDAARQAQDLDKQAQFDQITALNGIAAQELQRLQGVNAALSSQNAALSYQLAVFQANNSTLQEELQNLKEELKQRPKGWKPPLSGQSSEMLNSQDFPSIGGVANPSGGQNLSAARGRDFT